MDAIINFFTEPESTPLSVMGAGGTQGRHLAALGPLAGAAVTVSPLNQPAAIVGVATTDDTGFFSLFLDEALGNLDNEWLLVQVTGGLDTDANDDGVRDATPTTNLGTLKMLVRGKTLKEKSVATSVLSDVFYRSVQAYLDVLPPETLERVLEELAFSALTGDIDGDGFVSYDDILSFNPTRATDKAKLAIDYNRVLKPKEGDTTSLVTKYHTNSMERVPEDVTAIFAGLLTPNLPAPDDMGMLALTINTDNGGVVTSPDIADMTLASGNTQRIHKMTRESTPIVLVATPEPEFRFSRWVGCPQVQSDNTCRVDPQARNADNNFTVAANDIITAQYMLRENRLAPGIAAEVQLNPVRGQLGVTFKSATEMLITANANDAPGRARMDSLIVGAAVHTGIYKRPQVKITGIATAPRLVTGGHFYQGSYIVEDVNLFDMFEQASFQAPDAPLEMDDLISVRYDDVVKKEDRQLSAEMKLPSAINKDYIEGPTPSGLIDQQGGCAVSSDEEIFTTEVNDLGQVIIACIEQGAEPVQSVAQCNVGERTLEIIDGRLFCIPENTKRFTAMSPAVKGLIKTATPATLAAKKIKASTPSSTQSASVAEPRLRLYGSAASRRAGDYGQRSKTAKEVWLAGYGRAFDMGDGVFLTNNPEGLGLTMVEAEGKPERITGNLRNVVYQKTCEVNRRASGCGSLIRTQGRNLFPKPFEYEFSPKPGFDFFKITVSVQINIDVRSNNNVTWVKPLRIEANTSGFITVTPTLGFKFALGAGATFEKSGRPVKKTPKSTGISQKLMSYDFAKTAVPAGAFFQGEVQLAIGADLTGEIAIETSAKLPMTARWDGEAAAGWGCRRSFLRNCTTATKFDFKAKADIKYAVSATGNINGVLEPYLEARIATGVRGVAENLAKLAVRGFLQGELLLEGPTFKLTNIPLDIANNGGKKSCRDGLGGFSINAYYGVRAFAEVSSEDSPMGKLYKFSQKFTFAEYKVKFFSAGWEFENEDKKFQLNNPKKDNVGFKLVGHTDPEPCTGGQRPEETERSFVPTELQLEDDSFWATTTRKMVMQKDGNFVLYDYDGKEGKDRSAIWASGTRTLNARLQFQRDGNLVIYNLRDQAIWASGTQGYQRAVLKMQADGLLVMLKEEGSFPIWGATDINLNAGKFELLPGQSIQTPTRRLVMQAHDGNLVLYKFDPSCNCNREALWASGTNQRGARAVFQEDGNFVIYNSGGNVLYSTGTNGVRNGVLKLQRDGNLVIYAEGGRAVFATGTGGR